MEDKGHEAARSMAREDLSSPRGSSAGREGVREGLVTPTDPQPSDGSREGTFVAGPSPLNNRATEIIERERKFRELREHAAALGVAITIPAADEEDVGPRMTLNPTEDVPRIASNPVAANDDRDFRAWVREMEHSARKRMLANVNTGGQPPAGWRLFDDAVSDRYGTGGHQNTTHANTQGTQNFGQRFSLPHTHTQDYGTFYTSGANITHAQVLARKAGAHDLPTFKGAVEDWPNFIAAYERTTAACGFSDVENLMRLQKALGGKARETVGHLLAFPSGLNEAMATLKARFGRPDLIVEDLIKKLRLQAAPTVDRLETLVEFGYAVKRVIATVDASDMPNYLYDVSLLRELEKKLPPTVCIDWARQKGKLEKVTVREFGKWCGALADDLCSVVDVSVSEATSESKQRSGHGTNQRPSPGAHHRNSAFFMPHPRTTPPTHNARVNAHASGKVNDRVRCTMCEGRCVTLASCSKFLEVPVSVRRAVVKHHQRCRICLESHRQKCPAATKCGVNGCDLRHHPLLHGTNESATNTHHSTAAEQAYLFAHNGKLRGTLLKYVPVTVHGPRGKVDTFAMLDDGSTSTFMDHGLTAEIGLKGTPEPLCLQWTGHVTRTEKESIKVHVQISGRHPTSPIYDLTDVHTVRDLALPEQSLAIPTLKERYHYLRGLDIDSYTSAAPKILIGINNLAVGHPLRSVEGGRDEPIASLTRLGWVVGGPHVEAAATRGAMVHGIHTCTCEQLTAAVKGFLTLDMAGTENTRQIVRSAEDDRALTMLEQNTRQIGERYETGLLWRFDDVRLPNNKAMAMKRFVCLQQKMKKDPVLAGMVREKMSDYIAKGYIRRMTISELSQTSCRDWYLPIFPVSNPNKPGKIRMVFDAAAKVNGVSLNSFLLAGPDLVAGLLSVLLKFREFRVGVVGDICEMFHRVAMKSEDQRSQMIFWENDNPDDAPAVYAVTVMTFGAACSPSSAQFVKNCNAERFKEEFPRAVDGIINEHYVDDFLASTETVEEATQLAKEVRYIHAHGGFEIRNWISNETRVLKEMQPFLPVENSISLDYSPVTEKVLGMWWETESDAFTFRLSSKLQGNLPAPGETPTKRKVLRTLMSVYDPMGLLGHFLMYLKVLLQDIWRGGHGWDDKLDVRSMKKWIAWTTVLPNVTKVRVPRCYRSITSTRAKRELHVFCDASEDGMAAVAYFRFEESGQIECALVGSKTRVAPVKCLSIPRLELNAATIGARLAASILHTQRIPIQRTIFWTDSQNVLSWLRSDHRRYHPYVACRVGELLERTEAGQWRWIPSQLNVADDGTKWVKPPELSPTSRWFRGPEFLWHSEAAWPAPVPVALNVSEEMRKHLLHQRVVEPLICFQRFSKWRRMLRSLAYVLRFLSNAREQKRETGPLTQTELEKAEQHLFRQIQRDAYASEIHTLKKEIDGMSLETRNVDKDSPLYQLLPHLDEYGVLRACGRLSSCSNVHPQTRLPIILPRDHYGTALLIQEFHEKHKHVNHGAVLAAIRARYVIPRLLGEYKRVRKNCQRCKIDRAVPKPPLMANIPRQRLATNQRAFSFVGVDYFGPILVAVGRRVEKRWGVILTCMTSRAIHLEIAHTLNTSSCIMAIRRFISKRGTPLEIMSDRGTNFVGASRELAEALSEVNHEALMTEFNSPEMKWTFNPPGAPHFGGCWERLVRSVKKVLSQFQLPHRPSDEALLTTFAEIELIINSRPLTYLPIDDVTEAPLTPNHLLLGTADGSKPPTTFNDQPAALKSAWKAVQRNADWFWRRWVAEYLPSLTHRTKWCQPRRPLAEGDVVVIADGNLPRNCWPKGRILAVTRAKDGEVRQATVHTISGIYTRPATKIAVLDISASPTTK